MKERSMEKFVVFPFSLGCVSESSVPVDNNNTNNSQLNHEVPTREESPSKVKINGFLVRRRLSQGMHTLKRNFKGFYQLFVYKEEIEVEMEIGYPTDVKHVTHIGLDGSTKINPVIKRWDNSKEQDLLSFPSISIQQFELAMASQAAGSSRFIEVVKLDGNGVSGDNLNFCCGRSYCILRCWNPLQQRTFH